MELVFALLLKMRPQKTKTLSLAEKKKYLNNQDKGKIEGKEPIMTSCCLFPLFCRFSQ